MCVNITSPGSRCVRQLDHPGASRARSGSGCNKNFHSGRCPHEAMGVPQTPGVRPRRQKAARSPHAPRLDTAAVLSGPRRASSKIKSMNDEVAFSGSDNFSAFVSFSITTPFKGMSSALVAGTVAESYKPTPCAIPIRFIITDVAAIQRRESQAAAARGIVRGQT